MQFPLTEEMFFSLELSKPIDREFMRAFVQVVNTWYEKAKAEAHCRLLVTADILKTVYERLYNEKPEKEADTPFFEVIAEYMNDAWRHGLRDSGKVVDMPIAEIHIFPCFTETPPGPEKMERKEQYFEKKGVFQSDIILDEENNLIDGYTSYLLAKKSSMQCVPIRYGKRQIIRAYHKPGDKLYEWELPERLVNHVSVGDKVLVHTHADVRFVTVAELDSYRPQEHTKALRMAIRIKKGGVS